MEVSVLMMKTASESGWPEARNFRRASSRESARTEKMTRRTAFDGGDLKGEVRDENDRADGPGG